MSRKYDLILFDLDGTILDTAPDLAASINLELEKRQLEKATSKTVSRYMGGSIAFTVISTVKDLVDESELDSLTAGIRAYYMEHFDIYTVPFPGMQEALEDLKKAGFRLSVVSNKVDMMAKCLCQKHYHGIFDEVLAIKEGVRPKPDPAMCMQVIQAAGTTPERTLYVGDTEYDIETARNAGLDCMLVRWGYRDESFYEEAGAEYLVSDPEEMVRIIVSE